MILELISGILSGYTGKKRMLKKLIKEQKLLYSELVNSLSLYESEKRMRLLIIKLCLLNLPLWRAFLFSSVLLMFLFLSMETINYLVLWIKCVVILLSVAIISGYQINKLENKIELNIERIEKLEHLIK